MEADTERVLSTLESLKLRLREVVLLNVLLADVEVVTVALAMWVAVAAVAERDSVTVDD